MSGVHTWRKRATVVAVSSVPSCVLIWTGSKNSATASATPWSGYVTASSSAQPPQVGEKKSTKTNRPDSLDFAVATSTESSHWIIWCSHHVVLSAGIPIRSVLKHGVRLPLVETARRLGHRVESLVSNYVGALEDEEHIGNQRIDTILG